MVDRFNIVWSKESQQRFEEISNYLASEWTQKQVRNFEIKLKEFETVVAIFPFLFPESDKKHGLKRAVITKHNSVIYKADAGNKLIRVITIFDNRQHPKKLRKEV